MNPFKKSTAKKVPADKATLPEIIPFDEAVAKLFADDEQAIRTFVGTIQEKRSARAEMIFMQHGISKEHWGKYQFSENFTGLQRIPEEKKNESLPEADGQPKASK